MLLIFINDLYLTHVLAKQKCLKLDYVILISTWLLISLVLSNAFKCLLLSSYINMKYEFAAKSLKIFINNQKSEVIIGNFWRLENQTEEIEMFIKKAFKGKKLGIQIIQGVQGISPMHMYISYVLYWRNTLNTLYILKHF